MIDLFDVDAAFMPVERHAAFANGDSRTVRARRLGSGHTGTISITIRGAPGSVERRETPDPPRSDAVKPGIQCVRRGALTPWKPGSGAFGGVPDRRLAGQRADWPPG